MVEFLQMGGYGFYVWGSYGVVAVVLVWQYFSPLVRRKKLLAELSGALSRDASGKTSSSVKPR